MTDEPVTLAVAPVPPKDMGEAAAQLGFDVPRVWVTGAQVFRADDHVLIVFREQSSFATADGATQPIMRNVGSVVMPALVAEAIKDALSSVLTTAKPNADE